MISGTNQRAFRKSAERTYLGRGAQRTAPLPQRHKYAPVALAIYTAGPHNFNLNIGRDPSNIDRLFDGLIDDVRVYNRDLTAA
jgi:hypothetical protein